MFVDEIQLDGRLWRTADDFYEAYLKAVGAPAWHGRNLDALWDSMTGGDLNERNPPLRIRFTGLREMASEACQIVERFEELAKQATAQGHTLVTELEK